MSEGNTNALLILTLYIELHYTLHLSATKRLKLWVTLPYLEHKL